MPAIAIELQQAMREIEFDVSTSKRVFNLLYIGSFEYAEVSSLDFSGNIFSQFLHGNI